MCNKNTKIGLTIPILSDDFAKMHDSVTMANLLYIAVSSFYLIG